MVEDSQHNLQQPFDRRINSEVTESKPESPADRADVVIESLRSNIESGRLHKEPLRLLFGTQIFDDILQVYLGIKPMAGYIVTSVDYETDFYKKGFFVHDIINAMPNTGKLGFPVFQYLGVKSETILDTDGIWNPELVGEAIGLDPDEEGPLNPWDQKRFPKAIIPMLRYAEEIGRHYVPGYLFGIPKPAIDTLDTHVPTLIRLVSEANTYSVKNSRTPFFDKEKGTSPFIQFVLNENDERRRTIEFAQASGFQISKEFMDFIRDVRFPDVPGFKYITTSATINDEKRQRQRWDESGITKKLQTLLSSNS